MLEEWLKDPSKIGATVLLVAAVTAFFREWIIPGVRYTRDLAEKDAQIGRCEERIAKLEAERADLKGMLQRSIDIMERTQRVRGAGVAEPTP